MPPALSYVTFGSAVALYCAAATLFYLDIARSGRGAESTESTNAAAWLLGAAAAAHGGYVCVASFIAHVCPIYSVQFILSVASLVATSVYLVARQRYRIEPLGLVVAPVGLVITLATFFLGDAQPAQKLPAAFIGFHVFANLIGVALFLLAGGAAVMYLVQEKRLKRKKALLTKGRLPPLDALDRAAHRFLIAGFPLLTLGVITGTAHTLQQGKPLMQLTIVLGYATWVMFATVLLMRVLAGWRGRRAAYGTVAGFLCAAVVLIVYVMRPLLAAGGGG